MQQTLFQQRRSQIGSAFTPCNGELLKTEGGETATA